MTRTPVLKLIIAYKLIKAGLVAILAAWIAQQRPDAVAHLAAELTDTHSFWSRLGAWIQNRSSSRNIHELELLLWLDSVSAGIEGALLWYGRPWAQWVVVASLSLLVPFELLSLERRPSALKIAILLINVAVVAYLVVVRLTRSQEETES